VDVGDFKILVVPDDPARHVVSAAQGEGKSVDETAFAPVKRCMTNAPLEQLPR
jgi:hypothetical protein